MLRTVLIGALVGAVAFGLRTYVAPEIGAGSLSMTGEISIAVLTGAIFGAVAGLFVYAVDLLLRLMIDVLRG